MQKPGPEPHMPYGLQHFPDAHWKQVWPPYRGPHAPLVEAPPIGADEVSSDEDELGGALLDDDDGTSGTLLALVEVMAEEAGVVCCTDGGTGSNALSLVAAVALTSNGEVPRNDGSPVRTLDPLDVIANILLMVTVLQAVAVTQISDPCPCPEPLALAATTAATLELATDTEASAPRGTTSKLAAMVPSFLIGKPYVFFNQQSVLTGSHSTRMQPSVIAHPATQ